MAFYPDYLNLPFNVTPHTVSGTLGIFVRINGYGGCVFSVYVGHNKLGTVVTVCVGIIVSP